MSSCRDLVHRQTASAVVQHMSLGVYGFGCEDSLNHLLNYVWPNVFETSPHVIQAVMGALEGLRVAIGPCRMLQYCLQVSTTRSQLQVVKRDIRRRSCRRRDRVGKNI